MRSAFSGFQPNKKWETTQKRDRIAPFWHHPTGYLGLPNRNSNPVVPLVHGSKARTPSEHPNPHSRLKWVVNSPTKMGSQNGFDHHTHLKKQNQRGLNLNSGRLPRARRGGFATAPGSRSPQLGTPSRLATAARWAAASRTSSPNGDPRMWGSHATSLGCGSSARCPKCALKTKTCGEPKPCNLFEPHPFCRHCFCCCCFHFFVAWWLTFWVCGRCACLDGPEQNWSRIQPSTSHNDRHRHQQQQESTRH